MSNINPNDHIALIVDPDPIQLEIMETMLELEMTVLTADTAEKGIEMLGYKSPSIIIMERNFPDMDGMELVKIFKEKMADSACAIVMLSEINEFDDKMLGYQAGVDEFLDKPYQPEELLTKVKLGVKLHAVKSSLKQSSDESMKAAMTAMRLGSEMGMIVRFMEACFQKSTFEDLCDLFIDNIKNFGLDCSILIETRGADLTYGCEENSPEEQVLAMGRTTQHIVEHGEKLIINNRKTSVLVVDIPIDDPVRYGELKDSLSLLANALNGRVEGIEVELELERARSDGAAKVIENSHEQMKLIQANLSGFSAELTRIMSGLQSGLEESCLTLGLTEEQENGLITLVDNSTALLEDAYSHVADIESHFSVLMHELTALTK